MPDHAYNVLFLCTGNSARSILAEAILRKDGAGRFNAYSAGSHPKGTVHPLALKVLGRLGYPAEGYRSKSWDEFTRPDAPVMDFLFTVCDCAAGETCPLWPGHPATAHWEIENPAAAAGTEIEAERAFVQAAKYLKARISLFSVCRSPRWTRSRWLPACARLGMPRARPVPPLVMSPDACQARHRTGLNVYAVPVASPRKGLAQGKSDRPLL